MRAAARWTSLALLVLASLGGGQAAAVEADDEAEAKGGTLPYRSSGVTLRSDVRATSLAPGAELSYNPYVAVNTQARLAWWFTEHLYTAGTVDVTRELTNSDWTTADGEFVAGDAVLNLGYDSIWTDPWIGLDFGAEGEVVLPTSKAAQAQTLIGEGALNLGVSRAFQLLEGISVGYTLRPALDWHRYTTGENAGPSVGDCALSAGGCARFVNNGERNVNWSLSHDLVLQVSPLEWLRLTGRMGTVTSFLYPRAKIEGESLRAPQPEDARYLNYYQLAASFYPVKAIGVTVGTSTTNPQLDLSGHYYPPFFNRYTRLLVSLRADLAETIKLARTVKL